MLLYVLTLVDRNLLVQKFVERYHLALVNIFTRHVQIASSSLHHKSFDYFYRVFEGHHFFLLDLDIGVQQQLLELVFFGFVIFLRLDK